MDRLISALQRRASLVQFLPAGAAALILAELFYKFHSFTAECIAFLATWLVLDLVREGVMGAVRAVVPPDTRGRR